MYQNRRTEKLCIWLQAILLIAAMIAMRSVRVSAAKLPKPHPKTPQFLVFKIAGVNIWDMKNSKKREGTVLFDPQKGYCLFKFHGADHKSIMLVRVKTVKEVKQIYDTPGAAWDEITPKLFIGKLTSLSVDHGITVHDSIQDVIHKLGKPSDGDFKHGLLTYSYQGGKLNGWSYISAYIFDKHGRLSRISIVMQRGKEVPG